MPEKPPPPRSPSVQDLVREALEASQRATAESLAFARRLSAGHAGPTAPQAPSVPASPAAATSAPAATEADPAREGLRLESERIVARLREVEARVAERYDGVVRAVVARTLAMAEQKPPQGGGQGSGGATE